MNKLLLLNGVLYLQIPLYHNQRMAKMKDGQVLGSGVSGSNPPKSQKTYEAQERAEKALSLTPSLPVT